MNIHLLVLLENKAQLSPGGPSSPALLWNSFTCSSEPSLGRALEKSGQEGKSGQLASFTETWTGTSTSAGGPS